MKTLESILETAHHVLILSGEGETGTEAEYTGRRTMRAINRRMNIERCNGDRWAMAYAYSHSNEHGNVYIDLTTGEQRVIP